MTCITAMVKNGHVHMCGDLMGSDGMCKKVYPDSKVFRNGEFILGYTSSFRMGQILEFNWTPPLRQEGISDREYIQLNVIESLRETFAVFGYGVKADLEEIGGNFLFGYRGCIYEVQDNFSVLRHVDFVAVGSGQFHAEATIRTLYETDLCPKTILAKAISNAAYFTTSVSEECTFLSTDEDLDDESLAEQAMLAEMFGEMSDEDFILLEDLNLSGLRKIADQEGITYAKNISEKNLRAKLEKHRQECLSDEEGEDE